MNKKLGYLADVMVTYSNYGNALEVEITVNSDLVKLVTLEVKFHFPEIPCPSPQSLYRALGAWYGGKWDKKQIANSDNKSKQRHSWLQAKKQ